MNNGMRKVIADGLKANGYDGLYIEDFCACKLDDLAPCFDRIDGCRPGVFTDGPCQNCDDGPPCNFHIGPKAKETT